MRGAIFVNLAALALLPSCSFRSTDHLQAAGGAGGAGGTGGVGGVPSAGGASDPGGGPPGMDCDSDGAAEDLANDPAHCGICDHTCTIIGECVQGSCVVVTEPDMMPLGLSADSSEVAFVGASGGNLTYFRFPVGGGMAFEYTPDQPPVPFPGGLLMDVHLLSDHAVISVPGGSDMGFLILLPRGMREGLTILPADGNPVRMAGTTSTVCWADHGTMTGVRCMPSSLQPYDKIITATPPLGIALDSGLVYWIESTNILWSSQPNPATGGATIVASGLPGSGPVTVNGGNAYVVTGQGVWRQPLSGAPGELVSGPSPGDAIDAAFVGDTVYFTTLDPEPGLYRARLDGTIESLYRVENGALSGYITTSGNYVFFGSYDDDRVLRHRIGSGAFGLAPP